MQQQEGFDSFISCIGSLGWVFPAPEYKTDVIVDQVQLLYLDAYEEAFALARAMHKEGVQTCYGKTAHNASMTKDKPYFVLVEPFIVTRNKKQRPRSMWPRKPKL